MGDRKKGLGFDQLITINPPKNFNHDFYIEFYNSDSDYKNNIIDFREKFSWESFTEGILDF